MDISVKLCRYCYCQSHLWTTKLCRLVDEHLNVRTPTTRLFRVNDLSLKKTYRLRLIDDNLLHAADDGILLRHLCWCCLIQSSAECCQVSGLWAEADTSYTQCCLAAVIHMARRITVKPQYTPIRCIGNRNPKTANGPIWLDIAGLYETQESTDFW